MICAWHGHSFAAGPVPNALVRSSVVTDIKLTRSRHMVRIFPSRLPGTIPCGFLLNMRRALVISHGYKILGQGPSTGRCYGATNLGEIRDILSVGSNPLAWSPQKIEPPLPGTWVHALSRTSLKMHSFQIEVRRGLGPLNAAQEWAAFAPLVPRDDTHPPDRHGVVVLSQRAGCASTPITRLTDIAFGNRSTPNLVTIVTTSRMSCISGPKQQRPQF
ncbi:hypothetical protein B0T10DRAFT_289601 [Thelonectria olida]|uniref:Uncharacterized protein n=1 Tax=Thelonectria olida TaxID=1576542 RepID=A0A9P8W7X7_9HYPO|nr:hypothetical protein B0T10DRAFT_289601 [Thelonectria olida]